MWPFRFPNPDRAEPSPVIDAAVNRLLEQYEAAALEMGYIGTAGGGGRSREARDAPHAELVLLEPRANGIVTATVTDRDPGTPPIE